MAHGGDGRIRQSSLCAAHQCREAQVTPDDAALMILRRYST
jgi:hypothetical protein